MDSIQRSHSRRAKVTALEILFVLTLFAMIAGAAIYAFRGTTIDTIRGGVEYDIAGIAEQLKRYQADNQCLPSTAQGLQALVARPVGDPPAMHWRKLLPEVPRDPWGTEYQYRQPGWRSKSGYDLFSCGKDRRPETGDDIGNW
jgi:general secretion pathway protein G